MFDRTRAELAQAWRAVYRIPLWPEFPLCAVARAEHRAVIARYASMLPPADLQAAAHECIAAEREFLSRATGDEIDALGVYPS